MAKMKAAAAAANYDKDLLQGDSLYEDSGLSTAIRAR